MSAGTGARPAAASCKRCKSNVVNGIKCINCDSLFHVSCAKLSNVKILSDKTLNCCESENMQVDSDDAFFDAIQDSSSSSSSKVDISIFKYIIKQKDCIINELQDKIIILNNHIEVLNKCMVFSSNTNTKNVTVNKDTATSSKDKESKSLRDIVPEKKQEIARKINGTDVHTGEGVVSDKKDVFTRKVNKPGILVNKEVITEKQVSVAINEVTGKMKLNECINMEMDSARSQEQETKKWETVDFKRRRKSTSKSMVMGNNKQSDTIKGVPKYVELHVCRIDPGTTSEMLRKYLESSFSEVKCESLISRQPELYSSFKVSVYERNFQRAMDPNVWPEGALIGRFLYRREGIKNRMK